MADDFISKLRSYLVLLVLPKLKKLSRKFNKDAEFKLLDVGCGNHSATFLKGFFNKCEYYGLDKGIYNNDEIDLTLMTEFYQADLTENNLSFINDNFFDAITISHVIEHIPNGLEIIDGLGGKLKKGGVMYIEYPSVKSLSFPSMKGTLNFCDDSSHVRLYDIKEISNLLLKNGFKILKAGTRRNFAGILLSPLLLIYLCLTKRGPAGAFWDLLGFAEYVFAEKK